MKKFRFSVTVQNYKPYEDIIPMENISITRREMDINHAQRFIRKYSGTKPTIWIDYNLTDEQGITYTGSACFSNPDDAIMAINNMDHDRFDYVFQTHTDLSDKEYEKLIK